MFKNVFVIPTLIVLLLGACFYFFSTTVTLNSSIKVIKEQKENELNIKLGQEKELIKKELESKYKTDNDLYETMAKSLEAEKQKTRELQEKSK